ncbi:hypothetical protein BCR32DRAFT_273259 [Anaeromyces robustus]|uniref:Zn(2)-C6 fungal-type domain-containing protein n=1 Tax=Anaeromyces robustus TaxID=1754192 RepID=A0A1Y1VRU7_9FUNG|nr:hypothetical protein BCR32DRAFT_273259 [Anaeromyces robustus]|eukprot:ORX64022.1 hypothetical protein BCR32DRAFT_273259 [Anaeromyces robustus]
MPEVVIKKKRTQVKVACVNCQKACKKCDDARPCPRCIRRGLESTCVDIERKPRKTGTKRGPYNKKKNWKLEMLAIVCSYILENDGNHLEKILSEIKNEQIKNFFADEKNRKKMTNLLEMVNNTPTDTVADNVNASNIKREVECPK